MLHVRNVLTPSERRDYEAWLEKHRSSFKQPTLFEQKQKAESFWQKQAKQVVAVKNNRGQALDIPSGPSIVPVSMTVSKIELSDEMKEREVAACKKTEELKLRVAPVYNKGGYVYYSDGMLDSMTNGAHRRR
jgi:hypothetical protein